MDFQAAAKYARMVNEYKRLQKISTDTGGSIGLDEAKACGESFFIQCHSFKDWLKNEHPKLAKDIEDHITNSSALALAADYANTFKHGGLSGSPRSGRKIEGINQHTHLDLSGRGPITSAKLEITVDGVKIDALALAKDCLAAWDAFLNANNIVFTL